MTSVAELYVAPSPSSGAPTVDKDAVRGVLCPPRAARLWWRSRKSGELCLSLRRGEIWSVVRQGEMHGRQRKSPVMRAPAELFATPNCDDVHQQR
jgi:hypothetical protein